MAAGDSGTVKATILSPSFRSAAEIAGWDEESLLLATLIVEDTPVRESRFKKRDATNIVSPPSTRNRRSVRRNSGAIPPVVFCLDEDDEKVGKKEDGDKLEEKEEKDEMKAGKGVECMDRLREELSCAICLDICYEPSTTPCGHSFCLKCLKCASDKCGKRCPKCREITSIGRACTVNTVLWNTIQLLFPEEVEEKKKAIAAAAHSRETDNRNANRDRKEMLRSSITRSSSSRIATQDSRATNNNRRRASIPSNRRDVNRTQSGDAALALRLQREEFMAAFQDNREQPRNTASIADHPRGGRYI